MTWNSECRGCGGVRPTPTVYESRLFFELKRRGLPVIPQFCCNGKKHVDIGMKPAKLFIEVDGSSHDSDEQKATDELRDEISRNFGYKTLRFTNDNVKYNLHQVADQIEEEARDRMQDYRGSHIESVSNVISGFITVAIVLAITFFLFWLIAMVLT